MDEDKEIMVDGDSRREFLRKSAYVVPAILTLQAVSSVAKAGSNNVYVEEDSKDKVKDKNEDKNKQKEAKKWR